MSPRLGQTDALQDGDSYFYLSSLDAETVTCMVPMLGRLLVDSRVLVKLFDYRISLGTWLIFIVSATAAYVFHMLSPVCGIRLSHKTGRIAHKNLYGRYSFYVILEAFLRMLEGIDCGVQK